MGSDRVTAWAGAELVERVDERVEYGPPEYESRSQWIGEAMRFRMVLEDALEREGITLPEDQDTREAFLRDVAQAGIDAVGAPDSESDPK